MTHIVSEKLLKIIHDFQLAHKTPCLPPSILQKQCLQFQVGFTVAPEKNWRQSECSLRKKPRFCDANTGFPAKWRLKNKHKKILYRWRDTTLIRRVVLPIGWNFASANQKHYPDPGSEASLVWNFCTRFPDFISQAGKPVAASRNVGCFLMRCIMGNAKIVNWPF